MKVQRFWGVLYYDKAVWREDRAAGREDVRVGLRGVKPTPSPPPPLFSSSGRANRDMRQRKTMGDRQMSQSEISRTVIH